MCSIVWGGLADPVLKIAVAACVTVISRLDAQTFWRAGALGDTAARRVARGACILRAGLGWPLGCLDSSDTGIWRCPAATGDVIRQLVALSAIFAGSSIESRLV